MVFVNNKKFACESCIKGHRSSSCSHDERPLFEVKKKGRPVSQCETCRQLRQTRRMHSKCTCHTEKQVELKALSSSSKQKRFIPIAPALPNGLKDLPTPSKPSRLSQNWSERTNDSLNACQCANMMACECRAKQASTSSILQEHPDTALDTLAHAATLHCSSHSTMDSHRPKRANSNRKRVTARTAKQIPDGEPSHTTPLSPSFFDLPPILSASSFGTETLQTTTPSFPVIPPMSFITSLAGSGCTCGLTCACPGCAVHRGPGNTQTERDDCSNSCGSCVDPEVGLALPGTSSTSTIIDQFFARAAALPLPPLSRKVGLGVELDPRNVLVYPQAARETEKGSAAFGLVKIPKLECCGGHCACPEGTCGCGNACDGRCSRHGHLFDEVSLHSSRTNISQPDSSVRASCCSAKV